MTCSEKFASDLQRGQVFVGTYSIIWLTQISPVYNNNKKRFILIQTIWYVTKCADKSIHFLIIYKTECAYRSKKMSYRNVLFISCRIFLKVLSETSEHEPYKSRRINYKSRQLKLVLRFAFYTLEQKCLSTYQNKTTIPVVGCFSGCELPFHLSDPFESRWNLFYGMGLKNLHLIPLEKTPPAFPACWYHKLSRIS